MPAAPYKYSTLLSYAEDILSTNTIWQYGNISCDPVKAVCLCFVHTVVSLHTMDLFCPLRPLSNSG